MVEAVTERDNVKGSRIMNHVKVRKELIAASENLEDGKTLQDRRVHDLQMKLY